jgi:hypothetical protein
MTKYCVVASLNIEWVITNALDEQQCGIQGGVVQTRPDSGCSASSIAARSYQSLSDSGLQGAASGLAVWPLQLFRATFSGSPFFERLDRLNRLYAAEVEEVFSSDPKLARELGIALVKASFIAASFFGQTRASLSKKKYTKDMHAGFAELAHRLCERTKDEEIRAAVEGVIQSAGSFVDKDFNQIKTALNKKPTQT